MTYIHELPDWPDYHWDQNKLAPKLAAVRHRQGRLIGRMEAIGFGLRKEAVLQTLTLDVLKSSEIEGEVLNLEQVRSSVARRLGMDIAGAIPADRHVEGVVEMMLDATQNFEAPLTVERLFGWHAALFPTGRSGLHKIIVGAWRDDSKGPMQVVSGPVGCEKVHFEAPQAKRLKAEMTKFLRWVNKKDGTDQVLRAALAHLWFVTIHPFQDGNGRIARAIADWGLARSENSSQRFYSMSSQIRLERKDYYDTLKDTQIGTLDVTAWMDWFLGCLDRAIVNTEFSLIGVFRKAKFWETNADTSLNDRQRLLLNKLLDGLDGKLTSTKWAKIAKCSQDTAQRDIQALIDQRILVKEEAGGRSTSYSLVD
ncbi:Fic family protein [Nitrospira sp. BLG_2]|uniref:Fic family protein n=1 Tax=Nitrospira sp. BLG_2 TaxID=3397507 RepID=UPI003B9B5C89